MPHPSPNSYTFSLDSLLKGVPKLNELIQGGIQFPGEGVSQERDVVVPQEGFPGLISLLSNIVAVPPETGNTNEENCSSQLAKAADDLQLALDGSPPQPFSQGPDYLNCPASTTWIANVTVENIPNADGSLDLVLKKVSCAPVTQYPEGTVFDSQQEYNAYLKEHPPEPSDHWVLVFPEPNSTDVVSLPVLTVADPGAAKLQITPGYSDQTAQGSTTEVLPPSLDAWIESNEVDQLFNANLSPVDPLDPNPTAGETGGGESGDEGDDEGGEDSDDGRTGSTGTSDPDQESPDPIDPEDDGDGGVPGEAS